MVAITKIIKKLTKKDVFYLSLICIIVYALNFLPNCSGKKVETIESVHEELYQAMNDSIKTYKDAIGRTVYEKKTIETSFEMFKKATADTNRYKDGVIRRLASLVNKNTYAGVSVNTSTNISNVVVTNTIHDTLYINEQLIVNKNYVVKDSSKWIDLNVFVGPDSSNYDLTVNSEYDIAIEKEKFNLFKPFKDRPLKVKVINNNPYTSVTNMNAFVPVKEKKKYRGVKYAIVFGAGLILGNKIR